MAIIYPFPHWSAFTQYTPTIPKFYWDVYSQEERILAICKEYAKIIAWVDGMVDTVNAQYDIVNALQANFPELVNDAMLPALEIYTESGGLRVYVDQQLAVINDRLSAVEGATENLRVFGGASETTPGTIGLVPAPNAGDNQKFLCASGTWERVSGGGGSGTSGVSVEVNNATIGDAATLNIIEGAGVNVSGTLAGTTARVEVSFDGASAGLASVATSGSYNDLTNKPTIPAEQVQSNWNETSTTSKAYIQNKPALASVATSGSYNDLTDKPTIPAAQVQSNWNETNIGSKAYIQNKPTATSSVTEGSNALVTSGGVYNAISNLNVGLPSNKITPDMKVLFIGDSFLQGYAPEGTQSNYADIIASITGCTVYKQAEGGSGWATAGQYQHTFPQMVDLAYTTYGTDIDMVIVAGGFNDCMAEVTEASLASGMLSTVTKIRQHWADAIVYLFPNIWSNGAAANGASSYSYVDETYLNTAILGVNKQSTVKNINIVRGCWTWLYGKTDPGLCSSDGVHPLTPGQTVIANSMLQSINGTDVTVYFDTTFDPAPIGTWWAQRVYLGVTLMVQGAANGKTMPNAWYLTASSFTAATAQSSTGVNAWLVRGNTITNNTNAGNAGYGSVMTRLSTPRY